MKIKYSVNCPECNMVAIFYTNEESKYTHCKKDGCKLNIKKEEVEENEKNN